MNAAAIRWAGTRALLIELASLDAVLAYHAHLKAYPLPGQVDVLAAAETVLVRCDSRTRALEAFAAARHLSPEAADKTEGKTIDIEVVYDGEDLKTVGELTGLGADGVIEAHTGQTWRAAFGGFAPGFTYQVGERRALSVPRRDTPRTRVPAGAVALAGDFSAVYPSESPGGWQLIGRTNATLWDAGRARPALVRPGDRVRYTAVAELGEPARTGQADADTVDGPAGPARALEIVDAGLQSLIEDLGRPGLADLGVCPSGAADVRAARQANRLVGNPPTAAVIENTLGGLGVRATHDLVLALTGAEASADITGGRRARAAPPRAPFVLRDGETLRVDAPTAGLRCYLGVRGGFDVPESLGSRSSDVLSGIGPAPLSAGSLVPVGAAGNAHIVGTPEPPTGRAAIGSEQSTDAAPSVLRVTLGPRDDWFEPAAVAALADRRWIVTPRSNRVGLRFEVENGSDRDDDRPVLVRAREGELASEGVIAGALQVPPSGLPVLFLADHPVTGGYPVIAVVVPEDLPVAAQLAPGIGVFFRVVDPDTLQPAAPRHGERA